MDECIFCKIISGELPSHTVYEDDYAIAFMDIHPTSDGHVVIASKLHAEQLWDLDTVTYKHTLTAARKVATYIRQAMSAFRVGMLVEGLEVAHAHIHLIPLNVGIKQTLNEKAMSDPDHDKLAAIAARIRAEQEA